MDAQDLGWSPIDKKSVFSTRVFDVREIRSRSPDGDDGVYFAIHATDWVIVVPTLVDERGNESFVMVRQWRHGSERISVEFPGGVIDAGETPEHAAERELREETGYRAGKLAHAATISPNPAIMDNACHIFLATDLIDTNELDLDDDEFVGHELIPVETVVDRMGHGEYAHGLMSSALLFWLKKNGMPRKR